MTVSPRSVNEILEKRFTRLRIEQWLADNDQEDVRTFLIFMLGVEDYEMADILENRLESLWDGAYIYDVGQHNLPLVIDKSEPLEVVALAVIVMVAQNSDLISEFEDLLRNCGDRDKIDQKYIDQAVKRLKALTTVTV